MSDVPPTDRTARRPRNTLIAVITLLALGIGIALMAFAGRNAPASWWPWADQPINRSPAAAPPSVPAAPAGPTVTGNVDPVTLASRTAGLAADLASLETRAALIERDADAAADRAGRAEAILLATAARRALDRGVGLGFLDEQFRRRFGTTMPRETAAVIRASQQPVTLEDLRESLDTAAPVLLATESDWWTGIGSELRNLVVIHRAGTPSPLPSDRLSRARRMVNNGNVEAALAEVSRLPGAARATGWTDAARRYVEARHALDQLEAAAILGAITPPPAAQPAPAPSPQAGVQPQGEVEPQGGTEQVPPPPLP